MHPLSLRRAALLPICLFAAFVLLAQTANAAEDLGYGGENDIENPLEGDAAAIEHGKERYGARCGFCHGSRGIGAKGPCLSCNKFKAGGGRNLDIYSVIAAGLTINGRPTQMGGFSRTLSDDDIWSIIAYLRQEYKTGSPGASSRKATTRWWKKPNGNRRTGPSGRCAPRSHAFPEPAACRLRAQ